MQRNVGPYRTVTRFILSLVLLVLLSLTKYTNSPAQQFSDSSPFTGGLVYRDIQATPDNSVDLGTAALRFRTAYLGTSVIAPTYYGGTSSGGTATFSSTTHATKGKLLFGTSAYDELNNRFGLGTASPTVLLDAVNEALVAPTFAFSSYNDINAAPNFLFRYGKGTLAASTVVSDGDNIGQLQWSARGNTAFRTIAQIRAVVDGTFTGNTIPSRLSFYTEVAGGPATIEHMRLDSVGVLSLVGTTGAIQTSRLTTAQKAAIATPVDGMIVYDTDLVKFQKRENTAWVGLGYGDANTVSATVDFGATGSELASVTVTGAAWVSTTSVIVCAPTLFATADRTDGMEDAVVEGLTVAVSSRVAATGFTIKAAPMAGSAIGKFLIHCTGV